MGLRIVTLLLLFTVTAGATDERSTMERWQHIAMQVAAEPYVASCDDIEPPDWLGCSAPEAPEGLNIADPNLILRPYQSTEGR